MGSACREAQSVTGSRTRDFPLAPTKVHHAFCPEGAYDFPEEQSDRSVCRDLSLHCELFLEKLIITNLAKKCHAFFGTRRFFTQELATSPNPDSHESSSQTPTLLIFDPF
jgi:hypothetical protein